MPKALHSQTLVTAPLLGYCYITFFGYYFYRSNIGGTNSYVWFLTIPPLILLIAYFAFSIFSHNLRLSELADTDTMLAIICSVVAWLAMSWLYFDLGNPLLSLDISNLDVAELAVNSRYLQEFPRDTHIGFMGQSSTLMQTGDEIWFGPSLIVAYFSALLKTEPYKLQTLVMFVIAAQGGGAFFLLARQLPWMKRSLSVAFALLYAISPAVIYIAWQSFGAQMITVPIILTIFYLYSYSINTFSGNRKLTPILAPFVLLFSGILVTYHYMAAILIALLGFYGAVLSIIERSWRRLLTQSLFITALLILVSALNPFRILAIYHSIAMLNSNNGWFIPWISPIIQLGLYANHVFVGDYSYLNKFFDYGLSLILFTFIIWHLIFRPKKECAQLAFFLGLFLPIFLLGLYFAITGQQNGVLGGYRSFKISSTFTAITLLTLTIPLSHPFFENTKRRKLISFCCIGLFCLFSIFSLRQILSESLNNVYLLPHSVTELSRIETMNQVSGINILDMGNFTDLWANYFLLRKPQVFQRFPYGGRITGELNQPFTLIANYQSFKSTNASVNIFKVINLNIGKNKIHINNTFSLIPANEGGINLTPGKGWWDPEPTLQWSGRDGRVAEIFVDVQVPLDLKFSGEHQKLRPNDKLAFFLDGTPLNVKTSNISFRTGVLRLQKGRHRFKILSLLAPSGPTPWDGRTLGVAWRSFVAEQVQ